MWRLFERFVGLLVMILVVLCFLGALLRLLQHALRGAATVAAPFLGSVVATALVGAFGVGLLVRFTRWLRERGEGERRQLADVWRLRTAARRPADEVPAHEPPPELPEDPDPALGADGEA